METAGTRFVEENLKTIFAYALSKVGDKEDAEDLAGDIVVEILQSADRIREPDAFYGYVWKIAANTYRKFMRKKKRLPAGNGERDIPDDSDPAADLIAREDTVRLRREIALLSREYRECTVAYYYDELPCGEIARKLGISLEMVKYYLFKTRKILKEGICMEREFGEKSFRPAPFNFVTIFSGSFNREYRSLFARKLPGQILMSAYYTPMSTRELAMELGVASVYLEDEVETLVNYGLMTKTPSGKYSTNLVIFTEDFTDEFFKRAVKTVVPALSNIISSVKGKLGRVRDLNPICKKLSDSRILWALIWPIMRCGHGKFCESFPELQEADTLYDGATGTNYGETSDGLEGEFGCSCFAGYAGIDENYYASAADFGVLPAKNRTYEGDALSLVGEKIYKTLSGDAEPEFMILTEEEEAELFRILSGETTMMAEVYRLLFECARELMHTHAPKSIEGQIDGIVYRTLFYRTVGFIGVCAVRSGELALPDFVGPAAIYVRENSAAAQESVNQGVMVE